MPGTSNDPLELADLNPESIQQAVEAKSKKSKDVDPVSLAREQRLTQKEQRLASKAAGKEPSAPAPPPEPKLDRTGILDKILAYRERFPNLKKRNNVSAKSSDAELLDELHYCELQLGSQGGSSNFGGMMLHAGMYGIEKFTHDYWNPLGLNLTGLSNVAQQNMSEFQPILDELMIKHNAGMYTSPEWRLALAIGATVITVNAANQDPETAKAIKRMHQKIKPGKESEGL